MADTCVCHYFYTIKLGVKVTMVEIVSCESKYIDKALEITYAAWEPIFEEYRRALGEKMYNDLYGDWKNMKRRRVYNGLTSGRGYIALIDGEVAGFIFYEVDSEKKKGLVEENAVNPSYRGMGIAQKMYEFVLLKMREEGMSYAMVTTGLDEAHAPARRAYEKAGFDKTLPSVRYFMEL